MQPGCSQGILSRKTVRHLMSGRQYNGEIVEPFEFTHFRLSIGERGKLDSQTSTGVWLGKSLSSDEHLIASEINLACP